MYQGSIHYFSRQPGANREHETFPRGVVVHYIDRFSGNSLGKMYRKCRIFGKFGLCYETSRLDSPATFSAMYRSAKYSWSTML